MVSQFEYHQTSLTHRQYIQHRASGFVIDHHSSIIITLRIARFISEEADH